MNILHKTCTSLKAKYIIIRPFATILVMLLIVQTFYQQISSFEASNIQGIQIFNINSNQAHEHQQLTFEAGASTIKSIKSGAWSDPLIWDSMKIPSFGDNVIISSGTVVTYDVHSTNAIGNLMIDGKLVFSRFKSTNLDVGNIEVSPTGRLEMGTKDYPIPSSHSATIRFVMGTSGENGLMIRGQAEIHGAPIAHTFTKLASDVKKGDSTNGRSALFVVDDVRDWNPGNKIVITTTGRHSCTEVNSVLTAMGRSVVTQDPLKCYHSGTEPARADVALLTRNVVITSKNPNLRGHTMFMDNAKGSISYAEFVNLGPENQLGKYPIHFHKMGDASRGMYVQGASIWNSTNRWITIHSSNGIMLKDNVGYNSVGHGYFLESGNEVFNVIDHNIGILTRGGSIIPSDATSSVFWLENPYNRLTNNIAVDGHLYGYWYAVPDLIEQIGSLGAVNLRSLPILQFENNEAHNNGYYGLRTTAGAFYEAKIQTIPLSTIKNFLSWRNTFWGIVLNGRGTIVADSLFFGNRGGANIVFDGDGNSVRDSHAIGELDDRSQPAAAGVFFFAGTNNTVINSTLEKHNESTLRASADVRVGSEDVEITGSIVNTKMLSPRTIIFGYPQYSDTHIMVQNYIAPNDNHGKVPKNFTLWRIDNQMNDGIVDPYFVALVQRN